MDFKVEHTWDGFPVEHEPVSVGLEPGDGGVLLKVSAPFFNDPPAPLGEPGKPFNRLWDFEGYILRRSLAQSPRDDVGFFTASPAVAFIHLFNLWPSHMGQFDDDLFLVVEAFFLNDITEQYLEVELCPHGQHLVLLLSGRRNVWKQELPLSFKVSRGETKWEGRACIPWSYFPPNVTKFNSFAIHGSKDKRSHEALYPVPRCELQPGQKPDFHRLEYFKPFSFNTLLGEEWKQPESDLWLTEKPDL